MVDIRPAGGEVMATAERGEERIAAWARTRAAVAIMLFEHACGGPSLGAQG
jgi:hypothetical protein